MVQIYSKAKQGKMKLSEHFIVNEFVCKDGNDEVKIDDKLIMILENLRIRYMKPIKIVSGYRTPSYNETCSKAKQSKHCLGLASDIQVQDVDIKDIVQYLESFMSTGGIGYYPYKEANFVHIDVRTDRLVRWVQTEKDDATCKTINTTFLQYLGGVYD